MVLIKTSATTKTSVTDFTKRISWQISVQFAIPQSYMCSPKIVGAKFSKVQITKFMHTACTCIDELNYLRNSVIFTNRKAQTHFRKTNKYKNGYPLVLEFPFIRSPKN